MNLHAPSIAELMQSNKPRPEPALLLEAVSLLDRMSSWSMPDFIRTRIWEFLGKARKAGYENTTAMFLEEEKQAQPDNRTAKLISALESQKSFLASGIISNFQPAGLWCKNMEIVCSALADQPDPHQATQKEIALQARVFRLRVALERIIDAKHQWDDTTDDSWIHYIEEEALAALNGMLEPKRCEKCGKVSPMPFHTCGPPHTDAGSTGAIIIS